MSKDPVQQAVEDIEWLRDNGVRCEWREEEYFGEERVREHLVIILSPTQPVRALRLWSIMGDRETRLQRSFDQERDGDAEEEPGADAPPPRWDFGERLQVLWTGAQA